MMLPFVLCYKSSAPLSFRGVCFRPSLKAQTYHLFWSNLLLLIVFYSCLVVFSRLWKCITQWILFILNLFISIYYFYITYLFVYILIYLIFYLFFVFQLNYYLHFKKIHCYKDNLKKKKVILLNNRDLNIDQNYHDYDFCHNRPALLYCASLKKQSGLKHSLWLLCESAHICKCAGSSDIIRT